MMINQQKNPGSDDIFPIIILNARPGAGKSELITYLQNLAPNIRASKYHVGKIHVIDDFPYLWRWFEEDDILIKMGKERIFTDNEGYFKHTYLWDLLIQLINLEYEKFIRDWENHNDYTVFIEFSRGKQHGGYRRAYPLLCELILEKAVLAYVNVSWEESLRKNRQRFNPEKPDSILEHGIPDQKLEFMYSGCDFNDVSADNQESILIKNHKVPYSVFENEDDVTSDPGQILGSRLEACLDKLWLTRN